MKLKCFAVVLLLVAAGHAQVSATGSISAAGTTCGTTNACVPLSLYNSIGGSTGGVAISIPANASANTLQFEGTADGTNWVAVNATPFNSTTAVTSTTSTGTWQINAAGLVGIRVRCSTFVAGTATVTIQASTASARSGGGGGSGGTVTSVSGTANQIGVATGTTTPVVSLSSTIQLPGSIQYGTTTTSQINQCGSSDVWIEHLSGPCTNYASLADTDAARGTALLAACAAIVNGDQIYAAGEVFDLGTVIETTCDLSKGGTITASFHGVGSATVVKRGVASNTGIFGPGILHGRITDATITSYITPGVGITEVPILNRNSAGTYWDVTDFGMERLTINGVSDCMLFSAVVATSGYDKDVTCVTQWDGHTFNMLANAAITWTTDNSYTSCTPDSSNILCTCWKDAISSGSMNWTFKNANICKITNTNTASATIYGLGLQGTGTHTTTVGPGMIIDTSGVTSVGVPTYDVLVSSASATLTLNSDTVFNPAKLRNNGTIRWCQDLFSCPQQITGGIIGASGVGASTWSNGAVAPFSDAGNGVYAAIPTDLWLVNPTLTTSNTNGSAGIIAQVSENFGLTSVRLPWYTSIAPGAAAGVYRNTVLQPLYLPNGSPMGFLGANNIPTNGTALATVRGWTASIVGTNNTVLGLYFGTTIPIGATRYIGFSNTLQSTESLTQTVMPTAYSISQFCAYLSTNQGAGGGITITLDKAAVATGLVLSIPTSGGSGTWCTTGTAVTGVAGDLLSFKIVNGDGAAVSGSITNITAQDTPTLPATGQLTFGLGASTLTSAQLNNVPPFSGVASTTTILNAEVGLPRAVTIRKLYCQTTTCPGASATATVFKNGVATALTVTIPTSSCTLISDTTHSVSFAAGDLISLQENSASGSAPVIASCSVEHD